MRLTTKTRIAVSCLADLVGESELITLHSLAIRHDISISYLEQLFAPLADAGIVVGQRGPRGGYRLGKPATQITVSAVNALVENEIVEPGTSTPWLRAIKAMTRLMEVLTLDAIANQQVELRRAV